MSDPHDPGRHGRGREFLDFVATNEAALRRAVKKNITYDPEIFEEAFVAATIKVHDALEQGREIRDLKNYFFITAKWEYINRDNRSRRARQQELPAVAAADVIDTRGRTADSRPLLAAIRHRVGCRFGRAMRTAWERRCAGEYLTTIGREMLVAPARLSRTMREIDRFVATDRKIQQIKNQFYDDADTE